jgi:hypothetical protein
MSEHGGARLADELMGWTIYGPESWNDWRARCWNGEGDSCIHLDSSGRLWRCDEDMQSSEWNPSQDLDDAMAVREQWLALRYTVTLQAGPTFILPNLPPLRPGDPPIMRYCLVERKDSGDPAASVTYVGEGTTDAAAIYKASVAALSALERVGA